MRPPTWASLSRKCMPTALYSFQAYDLLSPCLLQYIANYDCSQSRSLQPNGLKVLNLIPGFIEKIPKRVLTQTILWSALPEDERELGRFPMPSEELAGFGVNGVRRPAFLRKLIEEAQAQGVPVKFGHQLVSFEQHEDSVTVKFANGATDTASFLVGCDGLHSDTRVTLFGKEPVSFTGLTQVSSAACRFPCDNPEETPTHCDVA